MLKGYSTKIHKEIITNKNDPNPAEHKDKRTPEAEEGGLSLCLIPGESGK